MGPKTDEHQSEEERQALIELAVNCRFISPEQEEEILPRLFEYSKNQKGNVVARFLLEKKILSKDKIEMLFAIRKHLDTLMADKKFGKIGVANEFVSPQDVQKALEIQVAIFRKRKKSVKIGDILVNNNEMSLEDQTAVLLTQDRIKDEFLAEALEMIGASEIERIDINKRFGAIAVKKGLISTEQLNQALKQQNKEVLKTGERRYLGQILQELFNIADDEILKILKMQKKFEVRRMELEEKLEEYSSQRDLNKCLDNFFEYYVSGDKLTAWVRRVAKEESPVDSQALIEWLALSGIIFGICPDEEMDAFLEKNELGEQLMVAQGDFPSEPREISTKFYFDTQQKPEILPAVREGDTLAELSYSENGESGTDVFGRPVYSPEESTVLLNCGEGVAHSGNKFIAMIDGYPRLYRERTLFILPADPEYTTKTIPGDISSDINEPYTILKVEGNIDPGINVSCHKLDIKGDILGHVTVTDDVDVYGHIGQTGDGSELPDEPVRIHAMGIVHAARNIRNSIIVGEKGINAPKSDLISSRATSFCDIVVKNIVSTQRAPSILWVGREYVLQTEKIDQDIQEISGELNEILHKEELEKLSDLLIDKVQVQNEYLEKQNAIRYLSRILNDDQLDDIETVSQKIETYESQRGSHPKDSDITIQEKTKAYKFMETVCRKIENLSSEDQRQYVEELHDSVTGMHKAAVRETQRAEKRYKARAEAFDIQARKLQPQVEEKQKKIKALEARKDFFRFRRDEQDNCPNPMIKVKNQVAKFTIIKGEKAQKVIDKDIYSISLEEEKKESYAEAKIKIDGYFE